MLMTGFAVRGRVLSLLSFGLCVVLMGISAVSARAQNYQRFVGTPHDLGRGCIICHAGPITEETFADSEAGTRLCLSCHDGALAGTKAIVLARSHSMGRPFNNDRNSLATPGAILSAGLRLYGSEKSVQCGSCHNPHDNSNGRFLRINNSDGSRLCITCHASLE